MVLPPVWTVPPLGSPFGGDTGRPLQGAPLRGRAGGEWASSSDSGACGKFPVEGWPLCQAGWRPKCLSSTGLAWSRPRCLSGGDPHLTLLVQDAGVGRRPVGQGGDPGVATLLVPSVLQRLRKRLCARLHVRLSRWPTGCVCRRSLHQGSLELRTVGLPGSFPVRAQTRKSFCLHPREGVGKVEAGRAALKNVSCVFALELPSFKRAS